MLWWTEYFNYSLFTVCKLYYKAQYVKSCSIDEIKNTDYLTNILIDCGIIYLFFFKLKVLVSWKSDLVNMYIVKTGLRKTRKFDHVSLGLGWHMNI